MTDIILMAMTDVAAAHRHLWLTVGDPLGAAGAAREHLLTALETLTAMAREAKREERRLEREHRERLARLREAARWPEKEGP